MEPLTEAERVRAANRVSFALPADGSFGGKPDLGVISC